MSTAHKGFRFATACAGFRKDARADLALLVRDVPPAAAAPAAGGGSSSDLDDDRDDELD